MSDPKQLFFNERGLTNLHGWYIFVSLAVLAGEQYFLCGKAEVGFSPSFSPVQKYPQSDVSAQKHCEFSPLFVSKSLFLALGRV